MQQFVNSKQVKYNPRDHSDNLIEVDMGHQNTRLFLFALLGFCALSLDPNCGLSTPGGECIFCNDLYFVKDGVCTAFPQHCSSGDVVTGMCNSCEPGFNLINGACVPGSGSASDSSVTSASLQSLSSSFGSSGSSGTSGSSQFGGVGGAGTTVTNITTVTTTTSTGTVPFCSVPNPAGGCFACQTGYNLVSNSCVPIPSTQSSSQTSQTSQFVTQTSNSSSSSTGGQFLNSQFSGVQPLNVLIPAAAPVSAQPSQFSSNQFTQSQPIVSQPLVVQPTIANQQSNNQFTQFNQFGQTTQNQQNIQAQSIPTFQPQPQTQTTQAITQTTQQLQAASPPIYQQPQSQQFQTQQTSFQQQGFQSQVRQDPYCASFSPTGSCIRCANRYYFSNNGSCIPISGNCNTYDQRTGACTSCYQTFILQNGECYVQLASTSQPDPNCKIYSGGVCRECYQGYIVSNSGICTVGNTLCRTSDSAGNCLSCYPGYALLGGNCSVTVNSFSNPNCANFSNGVCVRCSQGYYMSGGNCVQVNPLCNTFDPNYGSCLSCYRGYNLVGGSCVIGTQSSASANCRNFSNGVCVQCSNRYFSLNGVCTPVNDYCNTYNEVNGNCTSCYQGFVLQQGACYRVLVTGPQQPTQQPGGFQPNTGYVFSQDSNPGSLTGLGSGGSTTTTTTFTTTTISPCLQFDNQGRCIACAQGFNLNNGVCIQMN